MNTQTQAVLEKARQLSPLEQLDLIRALSESLQEYYPAGERQPSTQEEGAIPHTVRRTAPARSLEDYAADFWPEDESIDELNRFIRQQRMDDRSRDQ